MKFIKASGKIRKVEQKIHEETIKKKSKPCM